MNITKDTEIENRLTVTRGEGISGEKGEGVCRSNYKGHMDNNKGGRQKWEGDREGWGLGWGGGKKQKTVLEQ